MSCIALTSRPVNRSDDLLAAARRAAIAEGKVIPADIDQKLVLALQLRAAGLISEKTMVEFLDPDWLARLEHEVLDTPVSEWVRQAEEDFDRD
jgi:hypothetical protein